MHPCLGAKKAPRSPDKPSTEEERLGQSGQKSADSPHTDVMKGIRPRKMLFEPKRKMIEHDAPAPIWPKYMNREPTFSTSRPQERYPSYLINQADTRLCGTTSPPGGALTPLFRAHPTPPLIGGQGDVSSFSLNYIAILFSRGAFDSPAQSGKLLNVMKKGAKQGCVGIF